MSAPAIAVPGSVQRRTEAEVQIDRQEEIAQLAYLLWQQRGCPEGSADQNWTEAEERLQNSQQFPANAS